VRRDADGRNGDSRLRRAGTMVSSQDGPGRTVVGLRAIGHGKDKTTRRERLCDRRAPPQRSSGTKNRVKGRPANGSVPDDDGGRAEPNPRSRPRNESAPRRDARSDSNQQFHVFSNQHTRRFSLRSDPLFRVRVDDEYNSPVGAPNPNPNPSCPCLASPLDPNKALKCAQSV
jgi:hypothetical protein